MSKPARLQAALARLEARRVHLERQIVAEIDARFFSEAPERIISISASHDGGHATGTTLGTDPGTRNGSHVTITWVEPT